jgi:hypothetical protein
MRFTTSGNAEERSRHVEKARGTGKGHKKIKPKALNPEYWKMSESKCTDDFAF